jgi:signal transduction histidine kinase
MINANRLAALNAATRDLAAAADFAGTLGSTLRLAAGLVEAECALLVLHNKTTNQWFVHSCQGLDPDVLESHGQAAIQAAASGEIQATDSTVALPLKARRRVVGALKVERQAGLTHDDRLVLETFAASAALAIEGILSKNEFVSTVTHELRLPMTSIKGYGDLIRGGMAGPVSDMQQQLLDTVRSNVDWMNALVSDLGDIAKVETGRLKMEIEAIDPAACVEEAVAAMRPQFDAKTQTLAAQLGTSVLPRVRADRKRLIQMLTYLLTNANRYTAADGMIAVNVEPRDSFVRFVVVDNGIGVSPQDKARLFAQFFRSEDQVVRDHKGWGLALHLVKRLAEAFGGEAGAESEYGKGSTFWFTLPAA